MLISHIFRFNRWGMAHCWLVPKSGEIRPMCTHHIYVHIYLPWLLYTCLVVAGFWQNKSVSKIFYHCKKWLPFSRKFKILHCGHWAKRPHSHSYTALLGRTDRCYGVSNRIFDAPWPWETWKVCQMLMHCDVYIYIILWVRYTSLAAKEFVTFCDLFKPAESSEGAWLRCLLVCTPS